MDAFVWRMQKVLEKSSQTEAVWGPGVDEEVHRVQVSTSIPTAKLPQKREGSALLGRTLRSPQAGLTRESRLCRWCLLETSCRSSFHEEFEVASTTEDSAV